MLRHLLVVALAGLFLAPATASADIANFDMSAKIYTKWLYRNDASQGVLWLGNPFWPDDIAGNNGVATEFDLVIRGRVSKYVKAGVRLKSRFGGLWHDWWESGERKFEFLGDHNTSGDSLGMNRAQYIKLRGAWIKLNPNLPGKAAGLIRWVTVGASDLGMFNAWTIGKIRYIDRDNARGVFVQGDPVGEYLRYHAAVIALPRLWVGPNWSTGVGDDVLDNPYFSQDWAYGLKLESDPTDWWKTRLIGSYTRDVEFDPYDPDAMGSSTAGCVDAMGDPIPGCVSDHAVGTYPRYQTGNFTMEMDFEPLDWMLVHLMGGYSFATLGQDFATNGVKENGGMFPVIYGDTQDWAGKLSFTADDPFGVGLSLQAEGFRIGQDWGSIFGARREDDVLLTDGFIEGGQLPTLNLANEFVDFDEAWYETCIGWQGVTVVPRYTIRGFDLDAEFTWLSYDTNMQGRDVDETYPTFLYSEGFTDTDLYDYANVGDRGRDPRSVYKRDQDRQTMIAVLKAAYLFDFGLRLELKGKYIRDDDYRRLKDDAGKVLSGDDYLGDIVTGRFGASIPVGPSLSVGAGYQFDWWDETNRSGDLSGGYGDYLTVKHKGFVTLVYSFGNASLGYRLEYTYKDQDRPASLHLDDQLWKIWRAKATFEVAF